MSELVRDFSRCPRCGAETKKAITFSGTESEYWYECTRCNTFINTYIPQGFQRAVHQDSHRFIGNFGGYGSGKTTTSREEIYKHLFLTPKANILVGANVASQYEQTLKRDIEADLPVSFLSDYSTQKQYYDYVNGARIMYRPFDDPEKLRSYNLTMFLIMEGSEVKADTLTQLKSRLRNTAACTFEKDENGNIKHRIAENGVPIPLLKANWMKGMIESNPDPGWVKQEILTKSDVIFKHGNIPDVYSVLESERDPAISSHVTASSANEFLPPTFIQDLTKNKPPWWVSRYVFGSFLYAEGLVYPSAMKYVVESFEVPKNWIRICAYDYGLSDDSVFIFGAIDDLHNILYIYKEVRTNNRSVKDLAEMFLEAAKDVPVGGWYCSPIIDPKSGPKRDYDKKSLADHFADYGVYFKPGYISLDARIYRLNTYFECGQIRIMDCCQGLIKELREYKFPQKSINDTKLADKPEDKNNHGINPLEWIVMELPADPKNMCKGVYDRRGRQIIDDMQKDDAANEVAFWKHALSDDDEDDYKITGPYSE